MIELFLSVVSCFFAVISRAYCLNDTDLCLARNGNRETSNYSRKRIQLSAHAQEVKKKALVQQCALIRTTASTWGATFVRTRQVYTAVVRSAITYGATAWKHLNCSRRPVLGIIVQSGYFQGFQVFKYWFLIRLSGLNHCLAGARTFCRSISYSTVS